MDQLLQKLLTSLIEGSITYGPFTSLLLYVWLGERSERKTLQDERTLLLERTLKAITDAAQNITNSNQTIASVLSTLNTVRDMLIRDDPRPRRE